MEVKIISSQISRNNIVNKSIVWATTLIDIYSLTGKIEKDKMIVELSRAFKSYSELFGNGNLVIPIINNKNDKMVLVTDYKYDGNVYILEEFIQKNNKNIFAKIKRIDIS